MAGDFNSLPMSSVMSVFHNEDITTDNSALWKIPLCADQAINDFYLASNELFHQFRSEKKFEPL